MSSGINVNSARTSAPEIETGKSSESSKPDQLRPSGPHLSQELSNLAPRAMGGPRPNRRQLPSPPPGATLPNSLNAADQMSAQTKEANDVAIKNQMLMLNMNIQQSSVQAMVKAIENAFAGVKSAAGG